MDATLWATLAAGLVLLVAGAEALVRGASRLAAQLGISPLVIGLTVVAAGTSSPELAVSLGAALSGQGDIAVGNVVGSNIFNILFILGLCALITPLRVASQLVQLDVPVMIGVSLLVLVLGRDGTIGQLDGVWLTAGLVGYTAWSIAFGRPAAAPDVAAAPVTRGGRAVLRNIVLVLAGLALLVLGARWLVTGAVALARTLGVSELIIGLTVVAAGTSLPEVATSVIASLRGERDMAVGNVVGSNLFNLLGILGLTALVTGGLPVAPAAQTFDLPVMLVVAFACLPIFFTGHYIDRFEGALFLGYYVAYTAYLIFAAAQHDALPAFSAAMGGFVVPLTIVTLLVLVLRAARPSAPAG